MKIFLMKVYQFYFFFFLNNISDIYYLNELFSVTKTFILFFTFEVVKKKKKKSMPKYFLGKKLYFVSCITF